jgi:N-ethylmaleimide reductase
VLITAGGFTGETAEAAIRDGHADAVAFGRIFISIRTCRAACNAASR